MASNLRVGRMHAYQPYREVEAVSPYPRIDPQQPRDEYPQQQSKGRPETDNQVRRRFTAMRRLIDDLRGTDLIARVDYMTAEQEMVDIGLAYVEERLPGLLYGMGLSQESIEGSFQQLRHKAIAPEMRANRNLVEEDNFLPVFVPGLMEYGLCFTAVQLQVNHRNKDIMAAIRDDGRFVMKQGRFGLEFRDDSTSPDFGALLLDLSVLIGVSEFDEAGRKAILYQRRGQSFALYSDKQINLSI
jgi:hypothetical protein